MIILVIIIRLLTYSQLIPLKRACSCLVLDPLWAQKILTTNQINQHARKGVYWNPPKTNRGFGGRKNHLQRVVLYIYQYDDCVEQTKLEYCKDLFYKIEGWRLIFQPKIPSLLGLPFYDDRSFYYIHTYNPNAMAALEFIVVAPHPQHFLAMAFRR